MGNQIMPSELRNCAYCGKSKCRCTYRYGRMGKLAMSMQNTSEQTTFGEMKEQFEKHFNRDPSERGVWIISYTALSDAKLAKAKAKQAALSEPKE